MRKAIYDGQEISVKAEYEIDGVQYATILFPDREQNFVLQSDLIYIAEPVVTIGNGDITE